MTTLLARMDRRGGGFLALALLLLVTGLSLIPKAQLSPMVGAYDKVEHLIAYAAVALPIALLRPRGWPWMLTGVAAWSAGIELVQPLVGRSADLRDFAANLAGIALGTACAAVLRRLA